MKESTKVSVILPVYNVEAYIGKCIGSLRAQTMDALEFIFVDDCCTDGSMKPVEDWAAADERVRILRNEENMGAGRSRNRGIEAACGNYLAFMDPDDYIEPDFYKLLYAAAIADGGHDIAKGLRRTVDAVTGEVAPPIRTLNNRIRSHLAEGIPLYTAFCYEHSTAIYRRALFFPGGARYGISRNSEDITFLLRCCYQTNDLVFEESAVYYYVQREVSIVHGDSMKIANGQIAAMNERIEFLTGKGIDDRALRYLLKRANKCLSRLSGALKSGRVSGEDYDHIALRVAEVIYPIPGSVEGSASWPLLREALRMLRSEEEHLFPMKKDDRHESKKETTRKQQIKSILARIKQRRRSV